MISGDSSNGKISLEQLFREHFEHAAFASARNACCQAFDWVYRLQKPKWFDDTRLNGLRPQLQGTQYPKFLVNLLGDRWDYSVLFFQDPNKPPGQFPGRFLIAVKTEDLPSRIAFDYSFRTVPEDALRERNRLGHADPGQIVVHTVRKKNSLVAYDCVPARVLRVRQINNGPDPEGWMPILDVDPTKLWLS